MLLQKLSLVFLLLTFCQISNILAADPIKCYKCDATTADCITNLANVQKADSDTDKGCYTQIDSAGKVIRDVVTDQAEGANIKICKTNECNDNKICKNCDSSKDKKCAQTESLDATNEICDAANTKCLTVIKEKITYRRCATAEDTKACEAPLCASCDAGNCNTGIFPVNRIRCYQCPIEESKCMDVVLNSIKPLPCEFYGPNDTCYTYGTAQGMSRGCVSDPEPNKCPTPEAKETCATCTNDNCNGQMYLNAQKLQCITCKDKDKCRWAQSPSNAISCTKQVEYFQKEQCYTQVKGDEVYRGCLVDRDASELGADCTDSNKCKTCTAEDGNGCNNRDAAGFTCIRCRSDDHPECLKGGDTMVGTDCTKPVIQENAKCYYGIWNKIAVRGCLVDVDNQMLAVCTDSKSKQCTICDEKDCNKNELKNGAATVTISTILLSIVTLLAIWH